MSSIGVQYSRTAVGRGKAYVQLDRDLISGFGRLKKKFRWHSLDVIRYVWLTRSKRRCIGQQRMPKNFSGFGFFPMPSEGHLSDLNLGSHQTQTYSRNTCCILYSWSLCCVHCDDSSCTVHSTKFFKFFWLILCFGMTERWQHCTFRITF